MSEKKGSELSSILWIAIALLIIIIGQNFYYGNKISNNFNQKIVKEKITTKTKNNSENKENTNNENNTEKTVVAKDIKITFISDKRCKKPECQVEPIINQLKQIKVLKDVNVKVLDYSDTEAKKILEENGIKKLPAGIFSTNEIDEKLNPYLTKTKNGLYSLELGATFDPTAKRSEKGFLILDKKILNEIKANSYLKGDKNAKITWLEYSDLECPFCAKLHNSGTPEALEKKYGKDLNEYFQSFPLGFHKNALDAAEAIECLAKEKGTKAYYELKHIAFKERNSNKDFLIKEAVKLGANKDTITKCIENKTFSAKINKQQETGTKIFGVTGTPGNVLINNETGEYEVISGAYPTESFTSIIDKLLK